MSDIVLDLPDALAKEARDAGILKSDYIASMLRSEIRRRKINKLFSAADRLSESDEPLSEEEVANEIAAARQNRNRR